MATTIGIVIWLLSYFLVAVPLALDYENLTLVKKLVSSILPNTALHWAIGVMATLEGKGMQKPKVYENCCVLEKCPSSRSKNHSQY